MSAKKEKKPRKWWQKLLAAIGWILLVVLLVVAGMLTYLTIVEYKPAPVEKTTVHGTSSRTLSPGDSFTMMTWNLGFGALGDNADFFMDGGKMVQTATEDRVKANIAEMEQEIASVNPDVFFAQEIDQCSKRSYKINMSQQIADSMTGYQTSFANNFKVAYDPYPIPPMGKIDSGIQTFSRFPITEAERISLPCPFSWPVRIGNLKRCLLVTRIPLSDSDKELVLVNLHLEAYDSGEGKVAQTKQLKDFLQREVDKGNYVIAGGDFNQTFSNTDISMYPKFSGQWQPGAIDIADFGDDFQLVMDSRHPTCRSLHTTLAGADPSKIQYFVIDGFIVSGNLTINKLETQPLGFHCTDHDPVVMNVSLQ